MSESRTLRGKKIVVVGGGGLLGARICGDLASNGATVMIADQSLERAEAVAKKIEVSEGKFVPVVDVSITDESSVDRMIARCHEMADGIDALVNTAYPRNPHYGRKFEFVTYHDFCENVNLHLGGYFLISQKILQYFCVHGGGCLVNMSSVYGMIAPRFEVYQGTPMTMPVEYSAIKAGIINLTKYMAKYYAGKNIRVNCVSLGGLLDNQPESFLEAYRGFCLNKGMLNPDDIVGTIRFLLSDEARFMNGQNLVVDDGFTL